ncbi:GMP synthase [Microbacterium sp. SSW1-59]|uniref:glutamine amidotransferase-related protein n=1 Tax=Microbacterium xanthum TaxID=3079794 RepID=UPI002AD32596|nr:GMP synthase [Microbacterium sp. SSW1-59]MDZ8200313.1 GMP synthase [Microbacterium sp. SSW1-59]
MSDARILYVCARPQREASEAEFVSFRRAMGLAETELDELDLVRTPLDVRRISDYAGVVVGGSPFNVTDPETTKTDVQRRVEADLERLVTASADGGPVGLFTCYSIGVVTRMLGGTVSRAFPEDTGPTQVQLTETGLADPLFGGLPTTFTALTAHKEGTETLPPGAVQLATNPACPVQAFRVGERVYTTQFHPEPTPADFTERMVVYRNDGYFDAGDFDVVADRVLSATVDAPLTLLRTFATRLAV